MSLTKEQRDAMPADNFAVPEKRALPIHDETHVRMAWNMVDKTKGLTEAERTHARAKILERAKELGIDTADWHLQAMQFQAMAMEVPKVEGHPNRIPFSGILTRLDEPSDNPLGGSNGKRVILPSAVAQEALPSLLGMAVDFTPEFDGHDARSKIGLITEANVVENAIHIAGYFYGADFPEEVKCIQADKASLGFSYEAQAQIESMNDDPLVIKSCIFTGAAVLYKDCAAYMTTSLAANNAAKPEKEQMEKKVLELLEGLTKKVEALEAKAAEDKTLSAGSIQHLVKPHTDRLRAAADAMEAAGMGLHASRGHVHVLRGMADHMDAEAAMGKMPHIYYTNDFLNASADKATDNKALDELKNELADVKSELADYKKAKFEAAASPERKTLDPSIMQLLAKRGIDASGDEKIDVAVLNEALKGAGLSPQQMITAKLIMKDNGRL
jgi:hypothetical protein